MKNPPLSPNEWGRGTEILSAIQIANGSPTLLHIRPSDLKYMGTPFAAFLSHIINTTEGFKQLGEGQKLMRTVKQVGTQTNGFPLLEIICNGKAEPLAKPTSISLDTLDPNTALYTTEEAMKAIYLHTDLQHYRKNGLPPGLMITILKDCIKELELD